MEVPFIETIANIFPVQIRSRRIDSVKCGSLSSMRHAQAILVMMALLAGPLALLARTSSAGMPACNGMCCLPHAGHSVPARHPMNKSSREGMLCHRVAAHHAVQCACMIPGHVPLDYGLFAPMAPTTPSQHARIAGPPASRQGISIQTPDFLSASLPVPLQPPRS